MASPFGSPSGPLYPLGPIAVATPGTPVPLSQNVPITTAFGTSTSPAPMVATKLIFSAPSSNTGLIYLCFKGGSKALGNSVILALIPGQVFILESPQLSNPFMLNQLVIDADVATNFVYVTAVIV